jgi:hypothetical protein
MCWGIREIREFRKPASGQLSAFESCFGNENASAGEISKWRDSQRGTPLRVDANGRALSVHLLPRYEK